VVAENDGGTSGTKFTATFNANVILRMHMELCDLLIFSTGPYIVLADNSICLNRSAIKVV